MSDSSDPAAGSGNNFAPKNSNLYRSVSGIAYNPIFPVHVSVGAKYFVRIFREVKKDWKKILRDFR